MLDGIRLLDPLRTDLPVRAAGFTMQPSKCAAPAVSFDEESPNYLTTISRSMLPWSPRERGDSRFSPHIGILPWVRLRQI